MLPTMATMLKLLAVTLALWFVWIKYQQTRWRNMAERLLFGIYKEMMAADFDSLVARAGQPHETKTRGIGGHRFRVGWGVDRTNADAASFAGVTAIDDTAPSNVRSGQLPWINEVEVRTFVDYVALVPFVSDIAAGPAHYIRRNREGVASSVRPGPEASVQPVIRELKYLAGLSMEDACGVEAAEGDPAEEMAACAHATAAAKGYCSYITMVSAETDEKLEWLFDFERPDRSHVMQIAGQDADIWIGVGQDRFQYLGNWFRMPRDKETRPDIREVFAAERYIEVMGNKRLLSTRICRFPDRYPRFLSLGPLEFHFGFQTLGELEFALIDLKADSIGLDEFDGQKQGPWHVTLWIDHANGMLVRIDAWAEMQDAEGERSEFLLKQVFAYTSPAVLQPAEYGEIE